MALTAAQQKSFGQWFLADSIPQEQWEALCQRVEPVSFGKGEVIYSPKHFRRCLGVLLSGEAVVQKENGPQLNRLRRGDCFGAAALFAPSEEYVTWVKASKACEIVFLTGQELEELFLNTPETALRYISFLSGRIQFLNRKIDSFTLPSAEASVALWLLDRQRQGRVEAFGGYSRMARELNIGRASLYRCLEQLEEKGAIRKEGPLIQIINQDFLEQSAGGTLPAAERSNRS